MNIDHDLFGGLGAGALDDGPDLLGDPSLSADHFAHIAFGDTKLQGVSFRSFHLSDGDLLGVLHQVFDDVGKNLFQIRSFHYRIPAFFIRERTVSVG